MTANRSQRSALSGGLWTSYPVGRSMPPFRCTVTSSGDGTTISCPSRAAGRASASGVDILGSTPTATVAVGGRILCVRRLGDQMFVSAGPC